jgi:hypothetical protein
MLFTINQTTAFFDNADQMGIPADTRAQLANEGIEAVSDLAEFDKDALTQVADNLRRPGGRIPHPDANAPAALKLCCSTRHKRRVKRQVPPMIVDRARTSTVPLCYIVFSLATSCSNSILFQAGRSKM